MPFSNIELSSDLHETTRQGDADFPIQYYMDDFSRLSGHAIPLHWHQQLEFFLVFQGEMEVQVLQDKIHLTEGQAILINPNILHGYRQSPDGRALCPNIVFSPILLGGKVEAINSKYIVPLTMNQNLPCVVFHGKEEWQKNLLILLDRLFSVLQRYGSCNEISRWPMLPFSASQITTDSYEMTVQDLLNQIWQSIYAHRGELPLAAASHNDLASSVRIQRMITFIEQNYQDHITLEEIASSADIGRSEAARCFQKYLDISPVGYLISYRIRQAQTYLRETVLTIEEISEKCGFSSPGYFTRVFKNAVSATPSQYRHSVHAGQNSWVNSADSGE